MPIWNALLAYGRMIKFSHTLFALPFAGLSFLLAYLESSLDTRDLIRLAVLCSVCMFSARSAAMGFNRYVDSEIDLLNPRTENREIPSGKVSKLAALMFIIVSSFIFIFSSYLVNPLAFLLSFPALFLLFLYSLTKRFTLFCHLVLGLAIGLAPLGAWIAVTENLTLVPILFSIGLLFHIAAFDILYALQDKDFDSKQGLYSIPVFFGENKARVISALLHILAMLSFVLAGSQALLGGLYYFTLTIITGLLYYEHRLSFSHSKQELPLQFYQINSWISVVLFVGIFIDKWNEILIKLSEGISFH